ncbi:hypothetical protein [Amantichitinum ursilacus]|uniref:Uncharacterized protein n=1 Tax=Amantichitinum ursilacus TaxID=857265 RepID=A0A0N0XL95_9NEIS|nr:hypothetical protein [Amantichitinum ursilacus]KPC55334.1 hypothetical protein WG78_01715 [Amantichitinum ursilacus]
MSLLTLDQFPEQERTAFAAICREFGFEPDDFVVSADAHVADTLCDGIEVVTVLRDRGFQQYSPPEWIAEFEDSLAHGEFGAPGVQH